MPNYISSVAAATAILDADLFTGEVWARTPQDRTMEGFALRGSAVIGDTEVELFIDEVRVGNFFNNGLLFPNNDDLMPLESLFVPGGAQLRCLVRDAAATSAINAMVALEDA